ncbi:hypothetical protein XENOCAPTIV_021089, partial [Xenoophorus captivus]
RDRYAYKIHLPETVEQLRKICVILVKCCLSPRVQCWLLFPATNLTPTMGTLPRSCMTSQMTPPPQVNPTVECRHVIGVAVVISDISSCLFDVRSVMQHTNMILLPRETKHPGLGSV